MHPKCGCLDGLKSFNGDPLGPPVRTKVVSTQMLAVFLALSTQRLILPPAPSAAVMEQWLPRDLRVRAESVPPSQNGWALAMTAVSLSKKLTWPPAEQMGRNPKLDKKAVKETAKVMKSWASCFAVFREAVQRPRWIRPSARPGSEDLALGFPTYSAFKGIDKVLLLKARLDLAEGHPNRAVDDLRVSELAGERVCAGDGSLVSEFIGIAMLAITNAQIRQTCTDRRLSARDLSNLLKIVPVDRDMSPFADAIRFDLMKQFKDWNDWFGKGGPLTKGSETAVDRILGAHADALDWRKTVDTAGKLNEIALENTRRSWSQRVDLERECADAAKDLPSNFGDLLTTSSADPLDETQVATLRSALLKARNPLGLWLATLSAGAKATADISERRNLADIRATSIVVANQIYRRRKGRDVHDLGELVALGIIKSIPLDPFTDRPLRFDPVKKVISSAGPVGVDPKQWNPKLFQWRLDGQDR